MIKTFVESYYHDTKETQITAVKVFMCEDSHYSATIENDAIKILYMEDYTVEGVPMCYQMVDSPVQDQIDLAVALHKGLAQ
jgi:hypothetical protein